MVVVPFAGGAPALAQQLAALAAQDGRERFEIVVAVNRAEVLDAAHRLTAAVPDARVVDATAVPGAGAARNAGWRSSGAAFVLFCDADDEVAPGWFAGMRRALDAHELVRGAIDYASLNAVPFALNRQDPRVHPTKFRHLPFGPTCSLGIRRELLTALGGFDERLRAGEDIDLCWRAQYRGVELALAEDAVVHYRLRQTTGGVFRQGLGYGAADAPLYRRHRSRGARYDLRDTAKDVATLGALGVLGLRSPGDRLKLAHETGVLVGRLRGALQEERPVARPVRAPDSKSALAPAPELEPVITPEPVIELESAITPAPSPDFEPSPGPEPELASEPSPEPEPAPEPPKRRSRSTYRPVAAAAAAGAATAEPESEPDLESSVRPAANAVVDGPAESVEVPPRRRRSAAATPVAAVPEPAPELPERDPGPDPEPIPEGLAAHPEQDDLGDEAESAATAAFTPVSAVTERWTDFSAVVPEDELPPSAAVAPPTLPLVEAAAPVAVTRHVVFGAAPLDRPARPAGPSIRPRTRSTGMELADYLAVLRHNLLLLAAGGLVGLLGGLLLAVVQTPVYESTTRVLISAQSDSDLQSIAAGNVLAQQVVATYADVAVSPYILQPVADALDVPGGVTALTNDVTATAATGSTVLEVQVRDSSAQRAAAIANAIAARLSDASTAIAPATASTGTASTGTASTGSASTGTSSAGISSGATTPAVPLKLTVIQAAVAARSPIGPKPLIDVLVGLVVGLVLVAGFALLRQGANGRIQSVGLLRRATDLPLLGLIGRERDAALRVHDVAGGSRWGESFRSLRTSLDFADFPTDDRVLVVTSAAAGEGRTTTAANLAAALADAGESVMLVDADLRTPGVATLLGLGGGAGLSDVVRGRVALAGAVRYWGEQRLAVLPAGRSLANPSELLRSEAMSELLDTLRSTYTYVVIDTPPLGVVSDAALVVRRTAGVVLVGRLGVVTRAELDRVTEQLAQVGADVLGVVANDVRERRRSTDRAAPAAAAPRAGRRATHLPAPGTATAPHPFGGAAAAPHPFGDPAPES